MNVYLLIQNISNGVDAWENVLCVYMDETEANLAALNLEEKEIYKDISYYSKEVELK